jgi:membrane protease YdiL (CAAX protease family)
MTSAPGNDLRPAPSHDGGSTWTRLPPRPTLAPWVAPLTVVGMALYSIAAGVLLSPAERWIAALALVAVVTTVAMWSGVDRRELGLTRLGEGVRWGLMTGAPVAAALFLASFVPSIEPLFVDQRSAGLSTWGLIAKAVIIIPLGTALFEEYLFRGVLLAEQLRRSTPLRALVVNAMLFGMWHVFPALAFSRSNTGAEDLGSDALVLTLLVTVLITSAAGAFLVWLRVRAGSLAAPVLVHALINSAVLVSAYLASNRVGT